jgi:hypothetical protein
VIVALVHLFDRSLALPKFLPLLASSAISRLASSLEVPNIQFRNPIILAPSINKLAGGTDILTTYSDQGSSVLHLNLDMKKLNWDLCRQPSKTRTDQTES